ncbi:ECF RNA polymerase sigma factor SigJ [Massilia sp. Bi118]|uniref:sigma-70 family RNA polymerase sigma factor n=1 Tax=Massilia sp. Bi118 TaxID=2822346 RepID=UPI001D600FA6|nr:sigma-70 family RNA polymerase sigma factor [Massilia sp. Bi118]CAH0208925.1 ECF RNA polymerase sigma factor SigJ [Massilia sp. Bi118]
MPRTQDLDAALFEQLRPRLTAISRRIVGSEAEAQDIVQDCYLKWHRAEQGLLATPAAWLTTVVQHQSIDRLRKRARDAVAELAAGELVPDTPVLLPEEALLRLDEVGEVLARLLACLSPSERLALVLHEVFECEHADIAAVLGTRAVNARQHLARARKRLRLRLQAEGAARAEEKLCRELVRRFQAAINGLDVPAMVMVLAMEQPVSVCDLPQARLGAKACANDAVYVFSLAA